MFAHTRHALPRAASLMRDARVPLWLKAVAIVLAILIVSPLDLLGDIPILGVIDDVTLLAVLTSTFVRLGERAAMRGAAEATVADESASPAAAPLALPQA